MEDQVYVLFEGCSIGELLSNIGVDFELFFNQILQEFSIKRITRIENFFIYLFLNTKIK